MAKDRIVVELDLDDRGFVIRANNAGKVIQRMSRSFDRSARSVNRMERSLTGMLPHFTRLITIAGLARHAIFNVHMATTGWMYGIIRTNAEIERMSILLEGMSEAATAAGKQQEAAESLEYLFDLAEKAPFSITETTNALVKFRSVNMDLKESKRTLEGLTDAVAAFGGDDQLFHRASIAIQQMAGKGVISMEELRQQLGEAVPAAIRLMAQGAGMSYGKFVKEVAKGTVEAKSSIALMTDQFEIAFGGRAQRMMDSFSGMLSRLRTRWIQFQLAIGDAGAFEAAKKALSEAIEQLDPQRVAYFAKVTGEMLGKFITGLMKLAEWIMENAEALGTAIKASIAFFAVWKAGGIIAMIAPSLAKMASAIFAVGAAYATTSINQMRFVSGVIASRAAMTGAATAAKGFGAALTMAGGPLGLLLTALTAAATAWIMFGESAEEATQKLADAADMTSKFSEDAIDASVALHMQHANQLQREVRKTERALQRLQGRATDATIAAYEERLAKQKEALKKADEELAKVIKEGENRRFEIRERATKRQEASFLRDVERRVEKSRWMERELQLAASRVEGDSAEAVKARENLTNAAFKASYEARIEAIEHYKAKAQKVIDNTNKKATASELAAANAQMEILKRLEVEAETQYNNRLNRFAAGPKQLDMQGDSGKGDFGKKNAFEQWLSNTQAKVADTKADIAGLNGELAKFNFQVSEGKFKGLTTEDGIRKGRQMLQQLEDLNEQLKLQKKNKSEIDKATSNLITRESALDAQLEDLQLTMNSGFNPDSNALRGFEALKQKFMKMNVTLPETKRQLQELLVSLDRVADKQRKVDATKIASGMADRAREIRISLMSEKDQIKARYDYERDLMDQKLAYLKETLGEESEAYRNAYALRDAMADQHFEDMKTPLQRWADDGLKSYEALQQKAVEWADASADALTEFVMTGKMDFNSLANSIVADITRIIIKEQMSKIFSGAFGGSTGSGSTNFLGEVFGSLFGFAKGGVMTGNGPMNLQRYAMGGVANTPQLAMFGEGNTPEAYVPLPDGRSIPVSGNGGSVNHNYNVKIVTPNADSFLASQSQVAGAFDQMARRSRRNA